VSAPSKPARPRGARWCDLAQLLPVADVLAAQASIPSQYLLLHMVAVANERSPDQHALPSLTAVAERLAELGLVTLRPLASVIAESRRLELDARRQASSGAEVER
jgi:hypothetical protein